MPDEDEREAAASGDQEPEDEDVPVKLPEAPKQKVQRGFDLKLLKKTKDSLEVEVAGGTETILEPLKQALLEDDTVDVATYVLGHPLLDKPKLFVRVKTGKPQAALKKASKAIANLFAEGGGLVQKPKMRNPSAP